MDLLPATLGGLLAVILGFGFIIFVHELGHFLVAKWVGIKCPQFAIGMGHAICSWRKGLGIRRGSSEAEYQQKMHDYLKGQGEVEFVGKEGAAARFSVEQFDRAAVALGLSETEYRLNWLPLGGYVKMLGQEDMDPAARSEDPRSFNSKPIWARAAVISAGVVMNIIFGVIFFLIAFSAGVNFNAPIVGAIDDVAPVTQSYAAGHENDPQYKGLRTGDRITLFDGERVFDMTDVRINTALSKGGQKVRLTIEREQDGKTQELIYDVLPEKTYAGLLDLGFTVPVTLTLSPELKVTEEMPERIAEQIKTLTDAGVTGGMKVVEVGGKPVTQYHEYLQGLAAARGEPVSVVFEDAAVKEGQAKKRATVKLSARPQMFAVKDGPDDVVHHVAGFVPAMELMFVGPKSPAAEAGLKAGDVLVRIGGTSWPGRIKDVQEGIEKAGGEKVEVVVWRGKEELTVMVNPESGKLGVQLAATDQPIIRQLHKGQPAEGLSLPAGSRITSINGKPVETFDDILKVLAPLAEASPGGFEVSLGSLPNEGKERTPLTLKMPVGPSAAGELSHMEWAAPLSPGLFMLDMVLLKGETPGQALALGIRKTQQSMIQVYLTLQRVAEGSVHPKNFQGPIGIAHTGTKIARQGWTYLVFFLGLISVNLAVINFLPIPIVDGGHIMFLIIEKIKGSPVGPKVQTAALFVGLALLACMFLYVTFNDIVRLFGLA